MSQTLVLELPDGTWAELERSARERRWTPQAVAVEILNNQLTDTVDKDPLIRLFGSIETDITDGAERHDDYIGNAIAQSLRSE